MKILVTGSCGRIGRAVVARLHFGGHEVVGVDSTPMTASAEGHLAEFYCAELSEIGEDHPAVQGLDAVVHLAAVMAWVAEEEAEVFRAGVDVTFNLLRALTAVGVGRIVYASTGDVYPESVPRYLPIDEQHVREPRSVYGLTKMLGEEITWFFSRRAGVDAVVLRLPATVDPSELLDPTNRFWGSRFQLHLRYERERYMGNFEAVDALAPLLKAVGEDEALVAVQSPDGIHARMMISTPEDVAAAVVAALERQDAVGRTIGIAPDEPIDLYEFAQKLGGRTGIPVHEATLPIITDYTTSNELAKVLLGFSPQADEDYILDCAVKAWQDRRSDRSVAGR